MGRYDPTANDSDRIPQSSSATEMNTPTGTSPHERFWLSRPLMIVAISVACGAGMAGVPMAKTRCRHSIVAPMTTADVTTPMISP